ncbi:MAG: ATP-binding cassette domain-containing protein [Spirochaetales bacterium]|nr:ATP-binding cassette domain-containing protein [Spirochaetales bacterium]
MITVQNLSLAFGQRFLFKDVNIKFTPGNCYGIIGANGAGKSTFLKVLSGELEHDAGEVVIGSGQRLAVLRQDQFAYDEFRVIDTVIMGHEKLFSIMQEKDALYSKEDFSEEDGVRAAELEGEFAELDGWEAENEASKLLAGLGIEEKYHYELMKDIDGGLKVRVLLAQALFGNPDILLLDEPTNHLDLDSITWLEEFLCNFENTVIVVSHDRHFLNQVCTHIADIDYGKVQLYVGNYDFWYESSQIIQRQLKDDKRKREDKIAELKTFIQRFSSNASKSRQATSRKKLIDKLQVEDLKASSRRSPYVHFSPFRESGREILKISGLKLNVEGRDVFNSLDLTVNNGDKIAFVGTDHMTKTLLFQVLMGEIKPDAGDIEWGTTIMPSYFPKDNTVYFETDLNLVDWLRQYTDSDVEESYLRGFLGRMLFSGDEALKPANVLSGGEKVRCMLSKMMLSNANFLILDEPTNHLDLEAITALNNGLIAFKECALFSSHDHQFVDTIANRIIEFTPTGIIDRMMKFDDYLKNQEVRALRDKMYQGHAALSI